MLSDIKEKGQGLLSLGVEAVEVNASGACVGLVIGPGDLVPVRQYLSHQLRLCFLDFCGCGYAWIVLWVLHGSSTLPC